MLKSERYQLGRFDSMATTTFIAVQCFKCSTMQVKQQKKSSNKWTCVVCNEKQSVRNVYARNSMAKHVRSFVQSFNMSRKFAEDDAEKCYQQTLTDEIQYTSPSLNDSSKRKSTTDWTVYLDSDEQDDVTAAASEDANEPEVVTEIPVEMFKKRRLRRSNFEAKRGLYKPNFSKRTNSAEADYCLSSQEVKSKRDDASSIGFKEGSKWKDYLTKLEEEEQEIDGCFNTHPRNCRADIANCSDAYCTSDQQFEEDVHPEFK